MEIFNHALIFRSAAVRAEFYFSLLTIFTKLFAEEIRTKPEAHDSFTKVKLYDDLQVKHTVLIEKIWNETFDGNSRYDIRFYSKFGNPAQARNFWQSVGVYFDSKPSPLYEWNTADCSLMHFKLKANQSGPTILFVSAREPAGNDPKIAPQNEPERQLITTLRLTENYKFNPGVGRIYFKKINSFYTNKKFCTSEEIDHYLENFDGG